MIGLSSLATVSHVVSITLPVFSINQSQVSGSGSTLSQNDQIIVSRLAVLSKLSRKYAIRRTRALAQCI